MSIQKEEVAFGVRVILNDKFKEKSIGDRHLLEEPDLYIRELYNDERGYYVTLSSTHHPELLPKFNTGLNSGYAYLDQLDLRYPIKSDGNTIFSIIAKHRKKLENLKHNRSNAEEQGLSEYDVRELDTAIHILASILSDLNKIYPLVGARKVTINE